MSSEFGRAAAVLAATLLGVASLAGAGPAWAAPSGAQSTGQLSAAGSSAALTLDSSGDLWTQSYSGTTMHVNEYDESGASLASWTATPDSNAIMPGGIAISSSGSVYVAYNGIQGSPGPTSGAGVSVYTQSGTWVSDLSEESCGLIQPSDIALSGDDTLYVADAYANTIWVFSSAGSCVGSIGSRSNVFVPTGIALDSAGNIWVVSNQGNSLVQFSPGGAVITQWTIGSSYQLSDVVIDPSGTIYVSNYSGTVYMYTSAGLSLGSISALSGTSLAVWIDEASSAAYIWGSSVSSSRVYQSTLTFSVALEVAGLGTGLIATVGSSASSCGSLAGGAANCTVSVPLGTAFTAWNPVGSAFSGWSGSCSGQQACNPANYAGTATVTATFDLASAPTAVTEVSSSLSSQAVTRDRARVDRPRFHVLRWGAPESDGGSRLLRYEVRWLRAGERWTPWRHVLTRTAMRACPLGVRLCQAEVRAVNSVGVGPATRVSERG